jgi:plasmid stabilization system protein ParE
MARRKPALTVNITVSAQRELRNIWDYNAEHRSVRQADSWDNFLRTKIQKLATTYDDGRPVEGLPNLKNITAKKRASDDGHVVIYEVDDTTKIVNILHVFHTKQDIQGRLESEFQ